MFDLDMLPGTVALVVIVTIFLSFGLYGLVTAEKPQPKLKNTAEMYQPIER